MNHASLSSLDDSLAALEGGTLDEKGLVAFFESVTGLAAADHPDAILACEAALEEQFDSSEPELESRLGGWIVDLKSSTAKFALSAAIMTGVLVAGGFDQIPAYVLPAVLPLLVDVERAKLNRGDRKLLVQLRDAPGLTIGNPVDTDALYNTLPASVRHQISPISFAEFVEKLVAAGEADEAAGGQVTLREHPKWVRISFE
jgi:hypothetical protein